MSGAVVGLFLLLAASAVASVRFAAPGGTAADPCASKENPCSLFTAASVNSPGTTIDAFDEVSLAPGVYSDTAGDLGPARTVLLRETTFLRGVPTGPRPVIQINDPASPPALVLPNLALVRYVEITSGVAAANLRLIEGGIENVISVNTRDGGTPCRVTGPGGMKNSVCISRGANGVAIDGDVTPAGLLVTAGWGLFNTTAIATGPGSIALRARLTGVGNAPFRGQNVIADGTMTDIVAEGLSPAPHTPGTGGIANVEMKTSAYSTVSTAGDAGGGHGEITSAAAEGNVTAAPLLAADSFHQLPLSPTVDAGFLENVGPEADIDEGQRGLGLSVDIGADELQTAPQMTLSCAPGALVAGKATTCTVTASDVLVAGATAPTGPVAFESDAGGAFGGNGSCTLGNAIGTTTSCTIAYTPTEVGSGTHTLTGAYVGDVRHEANKARGAVTVTVSESDGKGGGGGGAGGGGTGGGGNGTKPGVAPGTALTKMPAKRTRKRSAKFVFGSDQPGATFECKLDRKPFKACGSPFKKKKLRPGRHSFQVRAIGAGGLVDPTPATYRWRIR
ncbi:MAG TPA: Ig-like domain-containing protein [Solirubrobacterales bacterium]|nr:Ig-like domain-containing protein [Solirubrobacterales bacterium]